MSDKPSQRETSFSWIPSAMWPRSISVLRLYYRYVKTKVLRGFEADLLNNNQVTLIRFPDREILIVWRPEDYPDPSQWDGVVDFSPYEKGTAGRSILDTVLISAHNAHDKTTIRDLALARPGSDINDHRSYNKSKVQILGDSGGAQLLNGKINWIDPHKVIEFYNRGVDIGMALDIPPRQADQIHPKVVKAAAMAQRRSSNIFFKEKRPELKLFNVVHGFDLNQTRRYIDIVSKDGHPFAGWAVGSGAWLEMSLIRNCLVTLKEAPWPEGERHMHLFAVSGPNRIPFYAWLSRYVGRFTVDSTLWLQGIRYNRYLALQPNGSLETYPLGRERRKQAYIDKGVVPLPGMPLPCPCPVCTLFPSWEALSLDPKYKTYILLGWHNIYTVRRLAAMWGDMAAELTLPEYAELAAYSVGDNAHVILEFLETGIMDSMKAAESMYKLTFAYEKTSIGATHSLFDDSAVASTGKGAKQAEVFDVNPFKGEHLPSIADTTLPNYLDEATYKKLGLTWSEPNKDQKRPKRKKKPSKRYLYEQPKKADLEKVMREAGVDEETLKGLKSNKLRKRYMKERGIKMPKLKRKGVVVLRTQEEIEAEKEAKRGGRFRKKRFKRSVKSKINKRKKK